MPKSKTKTQTSTDIKFPSRYHVMIHNDNFTPMEFVIQLLIEIFNKTIEEAKTVTNEVHTRGKASAGVFSYEIAEQKVNECIVVCNYHGHNLKVESQKL
jgi:ATP-dependent Clp protease adaptor protein ClpS